MRLTSGQLIGSKDAPAGVSLRARSPESTADILVSWTDINAARQTLVLDRMFNSKDATFQIKSIRSFSDEDTEE